MISLLLKEAKKNFDCLENLSSPSGRKRRDIKENASKQPQRRYPKRKVPEVCFTEEEISSEDDYFCKHPQRRYPKRKVPKVCFTEEEISSEDDYFFCDVCNREFKEGSCPDHGPFFHVPDREVPPGSSPTRAQETRPDFLSVCRSSIKGAGLGIWTEKDLTMGLRFGPYEGTIVKDKKEAQQSGYAWEIRRRGKASHYIQGSDSSVSNWMRFVNCAPTEDRKNLMAYQFQGQIYYRTHKSVMAYTELLVWYGDEFGADLGLCLVKESKNNFGKNILRELQNISSHSGEVIRKAAGIRVPNRNPISSARCENRNGPPETDHSGVQNIQANAIVLEEDRQCATEAKQAAGRVESMSAKCLKDEEGELHSTSVAKVTGRTSDDLSKIKQTPREDITRARSRSGDDDSQCADPTESAMHPIRLNGKTGTNCTARKTYQCEDCDYAAHKPSRLKQHVEGVHIQRRPHRCPECDYRAQTAAHLRRHVDAVHLGKRSHQCPHCDYGAADASDLRMHIDTVHLKKRSHECPHCDYGAARADKLRRHIDAVHLKKRPHPCPHCEYKAAYSSVLKTHIERNHSNM